MSLPTDILNLNLPDCTEKVNAEYIWIGGTGMKILSKARTLSGPVSDPSKLPKWNYDGLTTGQALGENSTVILYPEAIFKDPFRRGNNILVMCDWYTPAGEPIPTNKGYDAAKIFSYPDFPAEEPCYGIEQEYTLLQKDVKWPTGWPIGDYPVPQGPYYCATGADKAFGHDIVNAHYKACLYAGINVSGINGEVTPGQWEFQVGPAVNSSAGDEFWVARYILEKITEIAGVVPSFDPKPTQRDWNGAGAHTNHRPTFIRVFKEKSAESFQSIPYVLALFSALLWLYYGLLTWDAMLFSINVVSCVIESIYLLIYLSYAPKKAMRITKIAGLVPSSNLKPTQGDWNGAGAQTNYRAKSIFRREVVVSLMLFVLVISNSLPLTGARPLDEKRLSPSLPRGPMEQTFKEGPAFDEKRRSLPRTTTPPSCRSNGTSSPNSHNRCPPHLKEVAPPLIGGSKFKAQPQSPQNKD